MRGWLSVLSLAAAALVLCGCAASRPAAKPEPPAADTLAGQAPSGRRAQADSASARPVQAPGSRTAQTAAAVPAPESLSVAAQLMIKACDNYLSVNRQGPKAPEVVSIKAATYYNNRMFAESRKAYAVILDSMPPNPFTVEAVRMTAQSFYEEKEFDKAQQWYRRLKETAAEGGDRKEAIARIAESNFRLAESYDQQQQFKEAAEQYEKVALEFPEAAIADVALYNAGLAYEKLSEWAHAILMFQRLGQRYPASALLAKAMFRTAKNYEKLGQWDQAGQTYLRVTASYPKSDLAQPSLYNAGFSFETGEKLPEAAATFEKFVQLFPKADEAADVLFKAGEIYGKLKDWVGVTRVNQEFYTRFGNDADRVVQALCMVGIALYMQNKEPEAIGQLQKALAAYARLNKPSPANKYYAAKAQYTMAEIQQAGMNRVSLGPPSQYREQLRTKSDLLDQTVENYSKVVTYGIAEWTTRSIYQMAEACEQFGVAVLKQERPRDLALDRQLGLELGIAKAVEHYFVERAMRYHEQNIKLGIKEKIEDKYVLESRRKLLSLPLMAGKNYLLLVDIAKNAEGQQALTGFALIARKLETLQKIAPFQERAIELFLSCLEKGAAYLETNDYYREASQLITGIGLGVGETYSEVVAIARDAPIPETFDPYEQFVYKTKLLQQIRSYEDQAVGNYLKTLKIAEAYKLADDCIQRARERLAAVLFTRGRCYDLLAEACFRRPPYPAKIDEAEREEYKARFEEVGMKLQEQALDIYKSVLSYAVQNFAAGTYVTHAYVRLYQVSPDDYGAKQETVKSVSIASGPQWKCRADSAAQWEQLEFDDAQWPSVVPGALPAAPALSGFPADLPAPMWAPPDSSGVPPRRAWFRRTLYSKEEVLRAELYVAALTRFRVFVNGTALDSDSAQTGQWNAARRFDLMGRLRNGKNVVAIEACNDREASAGHGVCPYLQIMVRQFEFVPKPPGFDSPLAAKDVGAGTYQFPFIKNFSPEITGARNDAAK